MYPVPISAAIVGLGQQKVRGCIFQIVSLVAKAVPGRDPVQISLEKRGITGLYN